MLSFFVDETRSCPSCFLRYKACPGAKTMVDTTALSSKKMKVLRRLKYLAFGENVSLKSPFPSLLSAKTNVFCFVSLVPFYLHTSSLPILTVAAEVVPPLQQLSANHRALLCLLANHSAPPDSRRALCKLWLTGENHFIQSTAQSMKQCCFLDAVQTPQLHRHNPVYTHNRSDLL